MDDRKVLRSLLVYFVCAYYFAVLKINPSTAESCVQSGACTCDFPSWTFDLTSLAKSVAADKPLYVLQIIISLFSQTLFRFVKCYFGLSLYTLITHIPSPSVWCA